MLIELEYAALDALNRNHISSPRAGSAEDLYQQMLAIHPTNETASRGIERVVEHHINAALDALASRQTTLAANAMAKARRLDPSPLYCSKSVSIAIACKSRICPH